MDISVVIPTFNRCEIVKRALETLFAQNTSPASFEVIVVVDGSTDGTAQALRSLKPACRFRVLEQANGGPASARNTGYKAAEASLVLFLDDDMLCDPGLIALHVAAHRENVRMVAIGAILISAESPPSLAVECINRAAGAFQLEQMGAAGGVEYADRWFFSNSSLPRALLEEFGGFDEAFRHREDLELGTRLFNAGVRQKFIGNAVAFQYFVKTSADLIHEAESFALADKMFASKHPKALIKGQLSWLANEPRWKRNIVRIAAICPAASDCFLAPFCSLGEALIHVPVFRNLGVHALQMRRRIRWGH